MRSIAYAALGAAAGIALVAGASVANAQTIITSQPEATQIITTRTTRTVRTVPWHPAHRQVVTTHTVTERVVPVPTTVIDRTVAAYPRPLYDEVAPAPLPPPAATVAQPLYDTVAQPLYDEVAPPPPTVVGPAPTYSTPLYDQVVAPRPTTVIDTGPLVATQPYVYRYVYEPDRILVIDPATGNLVQTIPR
jgi:hypothetical protein